MLSCNNHLASSVNLSNFALKTLYEVLNKQKGFIKVHAAEYLIWTGNKATPKKVFLHEDSLYSLESPYRIGIWRVLAQAEDSVDRIDYWKNKVLQVFGDTSAPDRLHSCETLAKLKYSPLAKYPHLTKLALESSATNMRLYAHWAVCYSSDSALSANTEIFLKEATGKDSIGDRKIAAYILQKAGSLSLSQWTFLAKSALTEPESSPVRNILLNTTAITWRPQEFPNTLYTQIMSLLHNKIDSFSISDKIYFVITLSEKGDRRDLPFLSKIINKFNSKADQYDSAEQVDLAAAAAYAILKIEAR